MKARKTVPMALVVRRMEAAASIYHSYAGKPIDPGNGWAQVPRNSEQAAHWYGVWSGLHELVQEVER